MQLYGKFEEKGYEIEAYMPSNKEEPLEFVIKAYKDKKLVKEMNVPMVYYPIFGVDGSDLAELENKTEELLKLLP